jgi:hypothetical protein
MEIFIAVIQPHIFPHENKMADYFCRFPKTEKAEDLSISRLLQVGSGKADERTQKCRTIYLRKLITSS